jgi:hypothetical protein
MRARKHLEICKENAEGGHRNGVGAIFLVLLCTTAAESRRKKKKDMHMGEAKKKATTSGEKRAAWAGNGSWGHSQACGQLSAASPRSWRAPPAGCTALHPGVRQHADSFNLQAKFAEWGMIPAHDASGLCIVASSASFPIPLD